MVVFPSVEWVEQDASIDPSGFRHDNTTGFIKNVNTSAGGALDFGSLGLSAASQVSTTKLCYARATAMGDASGVFNMKLFLSSITSWGAGTYRFLERKTLDFVPSLSLTAADTDTPTSVPANANFLGTVHEDAGWSRGKPWISGILDEDASQYVYLAVLAQNDVPVGTYGGAGAGSFRYRLLFDFS
jgi:hypothetical protein